MNKSNSSEEKELHLYKETEATVYKGYKQD